MPKALTTDERSPLLLHEVIPIQPLNLVVVIFGTLTLKGDHLARDRAALSTPDLHTNANGPQTQICICGRFA